MEREMRVRPGTPDDDNREYLPEKIKGSDIVVNENGNNSQPYPERLKECHGVIADNIEDEWYEYVPESYDPSKKTPLVLSMHGGLMTDGDRQSILPGQWRQTGTDLFWYFQMPVKTECGRFNGENGSQTRMLLDRTPTQRHRMESDSHQIMWTKTTMCILPLD